MKTIDYSYFIEKYIAGEMEQTEKIWFEKELEGNESLQKDLLLRRKADVILERHDIVSLRNKLVSIEKAKTYLGYQPQYDIKETIDNLFENRDKYADFDSDEFYNIRVFRKL